MGKLIQLSKPKEFKIQNISKEKAEIIIYDQIGKNFWGDGISAEDFSNELAKIPSSVNLIDVRINSPGGSVFEGYTIYNRLKQHKATIHVYIDGMAASIASVIAMAGDKVKMARTSQLMIHKPMTWTAGDSNEHMKAIERLDAIENQIIKVYREKTKMDYIEIQEMVAKETWFMADKALNHGFVDEIIDVEDEVKAAAFFSMEKMLPSAAWIRNKPEIGNYNKEIKNKVTNLTKEIEGFLAR